MKKKIAIGAVLVLCLSMLIYSTIAYFNTADTARNVITAGDIKIELQETAINNDGEEILFEQSQERFNVMPGQDASKIVRVKNTGSNPAYIRVEVQKAIALAADSHGDVDLDLVSLDFDGDSWRLGSDGFYYYDQPLAPGETTTRLPTLASSWIPLPTSCSCFRPCCCSWILARCLCGLCSSSCSASCW